MTSMARAWFFCALLLLAAGPARADVAGPPELWIPYRPLARTGAATGTAEAGAGTAPAPAAKEAVGGSFMIGLFLASLMMSTGMYILRRPRLEGRSVGVPSPA